MKMLKFYNASLPSRSSKVSVGYLFYQLARWSIINRMILVLMQHLCSKPQFLRAVFNEPKGDKARQASSLLLGWLCQHLLRLWQGRLVENWGSLETSPSCWKEPEAAGSVPRTCSAVKQATSDQAGKRDTVAPVVLSSQDGELRPRHRVSVTDKLLLDASLLHLMQTGWLSSFVFSSQSSVRTASCLSNLQCLTQMRGFVWRDDRGFNPRIFVPYLHFQNTFRGFNIPHLVDMEYMAQSLEGYWL